MEKSEEWKAIALAGEEERNALHKILDDGNAIMAGSLAERISDVVADRDAAIAERDAARAEIERLREATIEFVNTMSDVAPVWTGKMSEALNRLSPLLISDARRYNGLSSY